MLAGHWIADDKSLESDTISDCRNRGAGGSNNKVTPTPYYH